LFNNRKIFTGAWITNALPDISGLPNGELTLTYVGDYNGYTFPNIEKHLAYKSVPLWFEPGDASPYKITKNYNYEGKSDDINTTWETWTWCTEQNGGGTVYRKTDNQYDETDRLELTSDTTLYLRIVVFAETLLNVARDGYTFEGWYTEAEGGHQVFPTDEVTDDMTVYAHWKPAVSMEINTEYTVNEDFPDGKGQGWYTFTPPQAGGTFTFMSTGSLYCRVNGELYDENMNVLQWYRDTPTGPNCNFIFTQNLTAGRTYYLHTDFWFLDENDIYNVKVVSNKIPGDANCDLIVNINDILFVRDLIFDFEDEISPQGLKNLNVESIKEMNINTILYVCDVIMGLIDENPPLDMSKYLESGQTFEDWFNDFSSQFD